MQIIVTCASLIGERLPLQLIYGGKTRCHSAYQFPGNFGPLSTWIIIIGLMRTQCRIHKRGILYYYQDKDGLG